MTDYIRIPKDAREGDIVWFRDGQKKEITGFLSDGTVSVWGLDPGWVRRNGEAHNKHNSPKWDAVGFQYADNRKPPLGVAKQAQPVKPAKQAKPKPRHHLVAFPTRAKARAAAKAFGGKVQS